MFSKLINWFKEMYRKMIPVKNIKQALNIEPSISNEMISAIELWDSMYKDQSPWLNENTGVYSLNLASTICAELARSVMLEMKMQINEPGQDEDETDRTKKIDLTKRANYLNDVCNRGIIDVLEQKIEYGMATGGLIIKPYVNNQKIYFDYNAQGEFLPLSFDDEGRITEIAFIDSFVQGNKKYTKVEHHIFNAKEQRVTISNTAYQKDTNSTLNNLGTLISLTSIPKWQDIEPEITLQNIDSPLYGYYKVAKANNIDKQSPLGVSVFSRAVKMIKKCDEQFSRLDWEFKGGEMALDIDTTAIINRTKDGEEMIPIGKERLFRKIDLGTEQTYNVFSPTLRDASYISGLITYLRRVEDLAELHRGALSDDNTDVNYSNELHLIITEQRAFKNTIANQKALQKALEDVIYVVNYYASLYNITPEGDYETNFEWDDSVVNDTHTQLEERLALVEAGILDETEVRAWYLGESQKTAQQKILEIKKNKEEAAAAKKLPDLYNNTLEQ